MGTDGVLDNFRAGGGRRKAVTIVVREGVTLDSDATHDIRARANQSLRTIYCPSAALQLREAREMNRRELVAECDGQICGAVFYEVHDERVHLQSLAVDPMWQRRGIARALIEHAARRCQSLGARSLSLFTVVETGNVTIFERLGFRVTSMASPSDLEPVSTINLTEAYMEMTVGSGHVDNMTPG